MQSVTVLLTFGPLDGKTVTTKLPICATSEGDFLG
jgi:hypothetical protein